MPIREGEEFCSHFLADTEEESEQLLLEFRNDISSLANKFASITGNIDRQDLEQEGLIGLARAKRDFDEDRSAKFRIFAIYKIKDAMREFVTTQAANVRIPYYLREALRLATDLRSSMEKGGYSGYDSMVDMWSISGNFEADESIKSEINKIRSVLANLAERSHTTVPQLLERAELMPLPMSTALETYDHGMSDNFNTEDTMVAYMTNKRAVEELKELLDEDEFYLLYSRYVDGKTIRDLAPELGISPPSVVTRTQKVLKRVLQNKDRILGHESHTDIEEAEPRHDS